MKSLSFFQTPSKLFIALIGLLAALWGVAPTITFAANCSVPSAGYATVQTAVNDPKCSEISLAAATFSENITLHRNVIINGVAPEASIIDGYFLGSVVVVQPGVYAEFNNVTLQHGTGAAGAGIYNDGGTLKLQHVALHNNTNGPIATQQGGGIYNNGGNVEAINVDFLNNNATDGAAIFNNSGTVTVTQSQFSHYQGVYRGGGIFNNMGQLTISDSRFTGMNAVIGMAIFNNGGTVRSSANVYQNNRGAVGAINNAEQGVVVSENDQFLNNNSYAAGTGIDNTSGTIRISDCLFSHNSAYGAGGAIRNLSGQIIVTNCTFDGNSTGAGNGGAIDNHDIAKIKASTFTNNYAGAFGGGVYNEGAMSLINTNFVGNTAVQGGNDVWNAGNCHGCP